MRKILEHFTSTVRCSETKIRTPQFSIYNLFHDRKNVCLQLRIEATFANRLLLWNGDQTHHEIASMTEIEETEAKA